MREQEVEGRNKEDHVEKRQTRLHHYFILEKNVREFLDEKNQSTLLSPESVLIAIRHYEGQEETFL